MDDLQTALREALAAGRLQLPLPGRGATPVRHAALYEFGVSDLSFARLAEAHTDAVAILAEAEREPVPGALYGVWASEGPGSEARLERGAGGILFLDGCKKYCSGAPMLDRALITVKSEFGNVLVDIPLRSDGTSIDTSAWSAAAFARTGTATVTFERLALTRDAIIGGADWYVDRVGFWHGAVGPAACWAGGAGGLVDAARALGRRDPHSRAQLGALEANVWGVRALLTEAARQIDDDALDRGRAARTRALKVRHLIERLCTDVLDRFGRATGPQLLAFDAQVGLRHAELALYVRQCHAERDLEAVMN